MSRNKKHIAGNIWKLYIFHAIRWFAIMMPTITLFFTEQGLSMTEIFILQSVFSIIIVGLEVPSGYFADRFGRRTALIIGSSVAWVGYLFYAQADGFYSLLVAELFLGVGAAFISGADVALLYDSLLALGREKEHTKVTGNTIAIGSFSEAIAAVMGGLLAATALRTPVMAQAAVMVLAIPLAFSLVEPLRTKKTVLRNMWKDLISIITKRVYGDSTLFWLVLYSSAIGSATLCFTWFLQPYLHALGVPVAYFGFIWAVVNASIGVFAFFAHRYERWLGMRTSLISFSILTILGYVLLGTFATLWAAPLIFIFYFIRGVKEPILLDYINRAISSDIRATVLSVRALAARALFAAAGPLFGWVMDVYTLQMAFVATGVTFGALGLVSVWFLKKQRPEPN